MKKILTLFLLAFSIVSFADNPKLSKDEFLKLYDRGRIKFEIMPMMKQIIQAQLMQISKISQSDSGKIDLAMLNSIEQEMLKEYKRSFTFFDPEMLNVRYVDDGVWRYSFFFDFNTTRQCKLRVDKINLSCGNPICANEKVDPAKHPNVDYNGVVIPEKYCEKAYNIKIKK